MKARCKSEGVKYKAPVAAGEMGRKLLARQPVVICLILRRILDAAAVGTVIK